MSLEPLKSVIGPLGNKLYLHELPAPGERRWTPRRKAEVVHAVKGGLLGLADACDRYHMSVDEFLEWQRGMDRAGRKGLRITVKAGRP